MPHKKAMRTLKSRWGVSSNWRVAAIFLAFSLAGTSIMFCKKPVYHVLHIPPGATLWIKIPVAIMIYQVMLLVWGTLLGEFRFFWEKEKKMALWFARLVSPKRPPRKETPVSISE